MILEFEVKKIISEEGELVKFDVFRKGLKVGILVMEPDFYHSRHEGTMKLELK